MQNGTGATRVQRVTLVSNNQDGVCVYPNPVVGVTVGTNADIRSWVGSSGVTSVLCLVSEVSRIDLGDA